MAKYYVQAMWKNIYDQPAYTPDTPIDVDVDDQASVEQIIRECAYAYWHDAEDETGDQETLVIRKTPDGPVYIRQRVEFRYEINITWQDEEGKWNS